MSAATIGAKVDRQQLKTVLTEHAKWLNGDGGSRADLGGADLGVADLGGADLGVADLGGADLGGAYLGGADLGGTNLRETRGLAFQIPQEGELIVWKAVLGGIAKLRIPADAKRTGCLVNRKCRAERVETLQIILEDGSDAQEAVGRYDHKTVYRVGEVTRPDSYDDDIREDCTHGVHFWLSREEAERVALVLRGRR